MRKMSFIFGVSLIVVMLLFGSVTLGQRMLKAPMPGMQDLVEMLAEANNVTSSMVIVHEVNTEHSRPYVMYTLEGLPDPPSVDQLPVRYSALIHPRHRPWEWMVGGGSGTKYPAPGLAASLGMRSGTSADKDRDVVRTVIFGEAIPEAAEISITILGKTHVRNLRETSGYLILLPDQDLGPWDIEEVRIIDNEGNPLPAPQNVS